MQKAKKLTQEQKLHARVRELEDFIESKDQDHKELILDFKSAKRELQELGEKIELKDHLFNRQLQEKDREIDRLMTIIKWQIKPESAMQNEAKKSTIGIDPRCLGDIDRLQNMGMGAVC